MAKSLILKLQKTYRKLLIAWTKGKTEKAIKLQHKLLSLELKRREELQKGK